MSAETTPDSLQPAGRGAGFRRDMERLVEELRATIPAANVEHLMLRDEVVAAAAAGRFRVHAVRHADQAIELLTGVAAGDAAIGPDLAQDTVNARVASRLKAFAGARREQRVAVVRTAKRGRNGRR
jgi:hypothetical protein